MSLGARAQVNSAITAVQNLMVIILGFGATNGLNVFLRADLNKALRVSQDPLFPPPADQYALPTFMGGIPFVLVLALILLLLMAFRFYYVNHRYLDENYRDQRSGVPGRGFLIGEFFFIFFEGILICLAGVFVDRPAGNIFLLSMALVVDGVWATLGLSMKQVNDRPKAKKWLCVNGGTGLFVICVLVYTHAFAKQYAACGVLVAAIVILVNTGLSLFGFNYDLFPDPKRQE